MALYVLFVGYIRRPPFLLMQPYMAFVAQQLQVLYVSCKSGVLRYANNMVYLQCLWNETLVAAGAAAILFLIQHLLFLSQDVAHIAHSFVCCASLLHTNTRHIKVKSKYLKRFIYFHQSKCLNATNW